MRPAAVITPLLLTGLLACASLMSCAADPQAPASGRTPGAAKGVPRDQTVSQPFADAANGQADASATTASAAAASAACIGLWQGSLALPGASLRLVIDIQVARTADGAKSAAGANPSFMATLFSPDQTDKAIPADSIEVDGDSVRFEVKALAVRFEGQMNAAHTEVVGTFHQNGGMLPLTLKKTVKVQPAQPVKPKPQEPSRPYPYNEEEVKYDNRQQNVSLAGTLTLPRAEGPFPAVLLITGSGPQDRDEALLGHKPFLVLADYLTRRGIAVLRVDDRGVGKSTGNFAAATSADFATDVQAGLAYLKTRKEINPAQIGLVGHSEGGLIGPLVASQSSDVAFVVMMAGPGVPGDQILTLQGDLISKAEGVPAQATARSGDLRAKMFAIVRSEPDAPTRANRLRAEVQKFVDQSSEAEKKQMGDTNAFIAAQSQSLDNPWMRYFLTYDPRPALRKVTCPVLALNGANDLQVPPRQSLPEIAAALSAGGNKDFTIVELPGLNHLFQTSRTGAFSEYAKIEETIAPVALKTIGDWIVQHTRPAHTP